MWVLLLFLFVVVSHIQRITLFGCQLEKVLYIAVVVVVVVSPAARGLLNKEKRLFCRVWIKRVMLPILFGVS